MITPIALTNGFVDSGSNAIGDQTTSSISANPNELIIVAVSANRNSGSGFPNQPTISGLGLTWDVITTTTLHTDGEERITLFKALPTTPVSGALVISHGGQQEMNFYWSVSKFKSVVKTGTNGGGAIVQNSTGSTNVSSLTVTLSTFGNVNNLALGVCYRNAPSINLGVGFTQLDAAYGAHSLLVEYAINNPSISFSQNSGPTLLAAAVELKARRNIFPGGIM